MEKTTDDDYLGDDDENDEVDLLKQLEERIQELEASGEKTAKQWRRLAEILSKSCHHDRIRLVGQRIVPNLR